MILLDSSLIVAYSNEVDENHLKSVEIMKRIDDDEFGMGIITDYIFDESVTVAMVRSGNPARATGLGDSLMDSLFLIRIDEESFNRAWEIFGKQPGPDLSFTDCTTIAVCRAWGICNIGTFDRGFLSRDFNVIGV
jgi:predicted nucleic acid-binding protein